MRHNGRSVIPASQLPASTLDLSGQVPAVACPDCHQWWSLKRSRLTPHKADADAPQGQLCPGSGQRIHVDLTYVQWQRRLSKPHQKEARSRATLGKPLHSNPYEGVCKAPLPGEVSSWDEPEKALHRA